MEVMGTEGTEMEGTDRKKTPGGNDHGSQLIDDILVPDLEEDSGLSAIILSLPGTPGFLSVPTTGHKLITADDFRSADKTQLSAKCHRIVQHSLVVIF